MLPKNLFSAMAVVLFVFVISVRHSRVLGGRVRRSELLCEICARVFERKKEREREMS